MQRVIIVVMTVCLLAPVSWSADQPSEKDRKLRDSYSLGFEFGNNLRRQGVEVDRKALLSAILEGLDGEKPSLSPAEMRIALVELRKTLIVLQEGRFERLAAEKMEEGKAFLVRNAARSGVLSLSSGLQYRVLEEGSGPSPTMTDSVEVRYRGTFIDGKEFDSSPRNGEPLTVPLVGVIRGWSEALTLMKAGSKWEIFVPPELAYGKRQYRGVPPNSTLIFELELVAFSVPEPG